MMVIRTCSFTVKGPGLMETPKIFTLGTMRAQSRTKGKEINCATTCKDAVRPHIMCNLTNTYTSDRDSREPEEEELVQTGDDDRPDHADEPGAEGATGHVGVVGVGDGGTDLRIRRVILCGAE